MYSYLDFIFFSYDKLLPKLLWAEEKFELHEQEPFRHQRISGHSGKHPSSRRPGCCPERVFPRSQTGVPFPSLEHFLICRRRVSVTAVTPVVLSKEMSPVANLTL